ncbi:MAG: hypothetical protein DMG81_04475 [Acidobacteria bacterium]|nr:MAG: hypothetical protein DMG81_04475 [Acidobacteriota bacterium]
MIRGSHLVGSLERLRAQRHFLVVISVVVVIAILAAHVAAFPRFFELAATIFGLPAMFAMFAGGFIQILFRTMDISTAAVVLVSQSRNCNSNHQRCAQYRGRQQLFKEHSETLLSNLERARKRAGGA